jgi:hypothetical protein
LSHQPADLPTQGLFLAQFLNHPLFQSQKLAKLKSSVVTASSGMFRATVGHDYVQHVTHVLHNFLLLGLW